MKSLLHLVGNLAPMLSGLLTAPLTARSLGVSGRGEVTVVLLISGLVVIVSSFGLGWVARQSVSTDPLAVVYWQRKGRQVSLAALAPALGLGLAVSIWFLELPASATAGTVILFVMSAFAASRSIDANVLISSGRNGSVGLANTSSAIVTVIAIVVCYLANVLDVTLALAANVLGILTQITVLALAVRGLVKTQTRAYRRRAREMSRLHEYRGRTLALRTGRAWGAQLLDAGTSRGDSLVVMSTSSASVIGLYSAVALLPQTIFAMMLTVVQLSYARLPALGQQERLKTLFHASLFVSIAILLVAWPVVYIAIPWFFGPDFAPARSYLPGAVSVSVGLALLAPFVQFLSSGNRPLWPLITLVGPTALSAYAVTAFAGVNIAMITFGAMLGLGATIVTCTHVGRQICRIDASLLWQLARGKMK